MGAVLVGGRGRCGLGRGQVRRRHARGGVLGGQLAQQRGQARWRQWREVCAHTVQPPALTIGVGGLVQRLDLAQDGTRARIDEIDMAEVPTGVAHIDHAEVAPSEPGSQSAPHPG